MTIRAYSRVSVANRQDKLRGKGKGQNEDEIINSIIVQKKKMDAYIYVNSDRFNGDEEVIHYVDKDVSGSKALGDRPAGARLVDDLKEGDTVVILKLDRMFRNASNALNHSEDWKARNIDLIIIELGGSVITDAIGKLYFTIMAAIGELEREKIRDRIIASKEELRSQGRYLGGKVPFGYRAEKIGGTTNYVIDELEQLAIRKMIDLRNPVTGKPMPYRQISAQLKESLDLDISYGGIKKIVDRGGDMYHENEE